MLRFVVRRLALLVPILVGLSILLFLWVRALPGGPAEALLGERATPEAVARVKRLYGLDRPWYEQYLTWVGNVFRGDLGVSSRTQHPVLEELLRTFPATVELALTAMIFAVGVGVPLGYFAARRHGTWLDHLSVAGSLFGITIPVFFLGYMLKFVFAEKLGILPTDGRQDPLMDAEHPTGFYVLDGLVTGNPEAAWDALTHLVLPGVALGTIPLAIVVRITRASVLDVLHEDYVRTAEAKGLRPATIRGRHVLRNALLPVVTIIGLQVGLLLGGAVLTETVFAFPGFGKFMADSIMARDYAVLQGFILFTAVIFVLVNLLVDIAYGLIDPRVRTA
ncbi:peptide ABC transporter permease [Planobispora rosea]|uniref:Peptide ABC transporter permease n=1 Tax=Planobispora rosea TaxID=35762 RepID=A0A8J3RYF1_PLARO|nr:ABC transporter permease [Planobispora rosea]GGS55989.1 peptide ABC transporter permease [Planobispora rosea]GIH83610.1 peptide ABC transporter permease [Planobispora rosea]